MRAFWALGVLLLLPPAAEAQWGRDKMPPHGFVPDSATAVRIAVAVWIPLYGAAQIRSEQPFVAKLEKDVWIVKGTMPASNDSVVYVGGTAVAHIAKRDGRILLVYHDQ